MITQSTAKRYFGDSDPINRVMRSDTLNFKVIAVVEDVPENSHFHFDIALALLSFDGLYNSQQWFNNSYRNYFMLHENSDIEKVKARLPEFTDQYLFGGTYAEMSQKGNKWELYLQPLTSIHLNSNLRGEFEPNGKREYVYIFLVVSIFILIIACINFINLATAKSGNRAKEVGLRKTVGAQKWDLIKQFMSESLLTSFFSLAIALLLVELTLVFLKDVEGVALFMPYFSNPYTIPALIVLGLVVGLLSGFYPALVLSSFRPIFALKSQNRKGKKSPWLRNVLVTLQFSISVILIIGTFVVYKQLKLLQNEQLGFDKENVIVINNASILENSIPAFKNDLRALPFVESASAIYRMPGSRYVNLGFGAEDFEGGYTLNLSGCDEDYIHVLKPEMLMGRFFSNEYGTDSMGIVINEEALKLLEYDEPLGKKLNTWGDPRCYFHIIGVMKDMYYESKHNTIQPMGLVNVDSPFWIDTEVIALRIIPGDYQKMIGELEDIWQNHSPSIPFDFSFFDHDYDRLYTNEMQTRKLFLAFSFLAIFIACLGLLGLASFIAQQKTKEIGIRKAMGATTSSISLLLAGNYTKWVLFANLIAWPLAWYFFDRWLDNFAYKADILWWYFLLAGIISMALSLITVGLQTIKASKANPVDALRYE
nr:FtsX-like permease family protein [Bacteroidota bacterium]